MRLAKHTQRPNSFRPPRYGPDDLLSQGSTQSDDSADDGSIKAIEPSVEPPALDAAETPAVPAEVRTKAKTKKTKKVSFDAFVLGGKPIQSKVAALPKPPPKKDMFLGGVSTNKSGKEAKRQLIEANGRIRRMETYIQHGLQPRFEELHGQLTEAVKSGWDCIDQQEKTIMALRRQVASLDRDKLNLEKAFLDKDRTILELQSKLETAKNIATNEKKQGDFYKKQAKEKRKPTLSVDDQIKLEAYKRDSQIKIAEGREAAKVKGRDTNKKNDLERQNQRYNVAKKNYQRNGDNGERVLSSAAFLLW